MRDQISKCVYTHTKDRKHLCEVNSHLLSYVNFRDWTQVWLAQHALNLLSHLIGLCLHNFEQLYSKTGQWRNRPRKTLKENDTFICLWGYGNFFLIAHLVFLRKLLEYILTKEWRKEEGGKTEAPIHSTDSLSRPEGLALQEWRSLYSPGWVKSEAQDGTLVCVRKKPWVGLNYCSKHKLTLW